MGTFFLIYLIIGFVFLLLAEVSSQHISSKTNATDEEKVLVAEWNTVPTWSKIISSVFFWPLSIISAALSKW